MVKMEVADRWHPRTYWSAVYEVTAVGSHVIVPRIISALSLMFMGPHASRQLVPVSWVRFALCQII